MALNQDRITTGTFGAGGGVLGAAQRNRVLRNTYWLLALSMIPTVLGAWIGVATGFSLFAGNPFIGLILFLGVAFGFFFAINKYKDSGIGVALLLGFTFFMGLMLSRLVGHVLGFANGAQLIMTAFGGTAAIFLGLSGYALVSRRDFSFMGGFLMVGILVGFVAGLGAVFFELPGLSLAVSSIFVLLMAGLILYQTSNIIHGGETNYIMATVTLYVAIFNLFTSLLHLLGFMSQE